MSLTHEQFAEFYLALHGYDPFPWQTRLAKQVTEGGRWPDCIALPTAAGKTSCVDVALFALAAQVDRHAERTAPRRIFFVVDRRVIVQQAFLHSLDIATKLAAAESGILHEVAERLRRLGATEVPLAVYQLRGGVYRDHAWARSILQPTIIATTVDQVGSRLLFRGYGVSQESWPIHAALVGNDSLILLDEAHCSQPFRQTVAAVQRYRAWGESNLTQHLPFHFVPMTGTPSGNPDEILLHDEADDRGHPILGKRLNASKPAKLVVADKSKGKHWQRELVSVLVKESLEVMGDQVRGVGVLVNRVQTARLVYESLRAEVEDTADVVLLTGRMRNQDKDSVVAHWLDRLRSGADSLTRPVYVVATQCLEVGADLDFHALVSECASLSALRQRFGRLNRLGNHTATQGRIVVRADQQDPDDSDPDPIYQYGLAHAWAWMNSRAQEGYFDMGVAAVRHALGNPQDHPELNDPPVNAPILFPAYLDCWAQTNPVPCPDPDPSIFLHGPGTGPADVQVVWRADLRTGEELRWADIVKLCPPSTSEAMAVPISVFRNWFAISPTPDTSGDIEGIGEEESPEEGTSQRSVLRWRGARNSARVQSQEDIRPGDTYILPTSDASSWDAFGHIPADARVSANDPTPRDLAEPGFLTARAKAILRLTPSVLDQWPAELRSESLSKLAKQGEVPDNEEFPDELDAALRELQVQVARFVPAHPRWDWLADVLSELLPPDPEASATKLQKERARRRVILVHPAGGFVLAGKQKLVGKTAEEAMTEAEESSASTREVRLEDHCRGVASFASTYAQATNLPETYQQLLALAGVWHDLGKADRRFQALLRNTSPLLAVGDLLAKSEESPASEQARRLARIRSEYPPNSRHELLSLRLAETRLVAEQRSADDDLLRHLLATHHGYARPLTPGRLADSPTPEATRFLGLEFSHGGESFTLDSSALTPAVLAEMNGAGVTRFWAMIRRYGWWGLPYLEALLRLADWRRSQDEQTDQPAPPAPQLPAATVRSQSSSPAEAALELRGLDGANPLAYLAALGLLRVAARLWPEVARLQWRACGVWRPFLCVPHGLTEDTVVDAVFRDLHRRGDPTAVAEAETLQDTFDEVRRRVREAEKAVKALRLRGPERDAVVAERITPLACEAEQAKAAWLDVLARAVPVPYLALGKTLTVARDPFRSFAERAVAAANLSCRETCDFAASFASDGCLDERGNVQPTQFQLITGSGHQYFLQTFLNLMEEVTEEKMRRSLFGTWLYEDPKRSFRWDPSEDARYAYQWADPSRDGVSTEHGANLLAAMALPLFPVVPITGGKAATTGFAGLGRGAVWTWPLWSFPLRVEGVRSLLALESLVSSDEPNREVLARYGVVEVYRSTKIEVGRAPLSKWNLTPATVA